MFWAPERINELKEMHFNFPFNLTGKSTVAILTGQSWCILKSQYTGGGQNRDFGAVSQTDLTSHNILVRPMVQANDSMDNRTFKTGNDVADF